MYCANKMVYAKLSGGCRLASNSSEPHRDHQHEPNQQRQMQRKRPGGHGRPGRRRTTYVFLYVLSLVASVGSLIVPSGSRWTPTGGSHGGGKLLSIYGVVGFSVLTSYATANAFAVSTTVSFDDLSTQSPNSPTPSDETLGERRLSAPTGDRDKESSSSSSNNNNNNNDDRPTGGNSKSNNNDSSSAGEGRPNVQTSGDYTEDRKFKDGSIIASVVIFIIGLGGNAAVIMVILRFTKIESVTDIYILNLAFADIMFTAGLVFLITTMMLEQWIFGNLMCKMYMATTSLNQFASSLLLVVMSFDRFLAVCHPIYAQRFRGIRRAKIICLCIWIACLVLMSPIFVFAKINNDLTCAIFWPEPSIEFNYEVAFTLYSFAIGFAFPLLLIAAFYFRVIRKLRNSASGHGSLGSTRRSKTRENTNRRVEYLVVGIICTYTICWLPYWLSQLFVSFMPAEFEPTPSFYDFIYTATCLSYTNSALNPILYAFLSDNFKRRCLDIYRTITSFQLLQRNTNSNINVTISTRNNDCSTSATCRRSHSIGVCGGLTGQSAGGGLTGGALTRSPASTINFEHEITKSLFLEAPRLDDIKVRTALRVNDDDDDDDDLEVNDKICSTTTSSNQENQVDEEAKTSLSSSAVAVVASERGNDLNDDHPNSSTPRDNLSRKIVAFNVQDTVVVQENPSDGLKTHHCKTTTTHPLQDKNKFQGV